MIVSTDISEPVAIDATGASAGRVSKRSLPGFPTELPARLALRRKLTRQSQRERLQRSYEQFEKSRLTDYFFGTKAAACHPREVFAYLRWGGDFFFVTHRQREAEALREAYSKRREFVVDRELDVFTGPRYDRAYLRMSRRYYCFRARKVELTLREEATDRHSYDVRLLRSKLDKAQGWVVQKQVPTVADAAERLWARFPDLPFYTVEEAAQKLVERVYPIFLTREAAFLKILQRELPDAYKLRVPTPLHIEKDERGFVRELRMSWLRLGGDPIDQLEFARQSAHLLTLLHDTLNIVHLDLRLDNYVVTPHGVGFVDFGSASRIGEDFSKSNILKSFFDEMLSNSQVQRDIQRMQHRGLLTSEVFRGVYHKIDKAVDLFYLLMELNRPHDNPDFAGLIAYDPRSRHARVLSEFTKQVFRPANPAMPRFTSVRDVRDALNLLE